MKSTPYIEYTKLETKQGSSKQWYHMSHLSNACASEDAHRTSAYAICLLSEGSLQLETNLFTQIAQAPAVFTIAPSAIRKFIDLGEVYDAKIFFFRKETFLEGQTDINYLDKFEFFEKAGEQIININEQQLEHFETLFELTHKKTFDIGSNTSEIIRNLIYIVLNEIDEIHQSQSNQEIVATDSNTYILSEFKSLLANHFINERNVSFYADKMHLTPKYFSTLIKNASGKTAGEWISEMLLLESRVRLQNKEQSITQIAHDLNFSDASHFGKFFKKHTELSPMEYRNTF